MSLHQAVSSGVEHSGLGGSWVRSSRRGWSGILKEDPLRSRDESGSEDALELKGVSKSKHVFSFGLSFRPVTVYIISEYDERSPYLFTFFESLAMSPYAPFQVQYLSNSKTRRMKSSLRIIVTYHVQYFLGTGCGSTIMKISRWFGDSVRRGLQDQRNIEWPSRTYTIIPLNHALPRLPSHLI
jgi:hypothetical protein